MSISTQRGGFFAYLVIFSLLLSLSLQAQSSFSTLLDGSWKISSMQLFTNKSLKKKTLIKFNKERRTLERTNAMIEANSMLLKVTFYADSGYAYKQMLNDRVGYFERGNLAIKDSMINAMNTISRKIKGQLDGEKIIFCDGKRMITELRVLGVSSGVVQRINYSRMSSN
jgi:hypothetical protein